MYIKLPDWRPGELSFGDGESAMILAVVWRTIHARIPPVEPPVWSRLVHVGCVSCLFQSRPRLRLDFIRLRCTWCTLLLSRLDRWRCHSFKADLSLVQTNHIPSIQRSVTSPASVSPTFQPAFQRPPWDTTTYQSVHTRSTSVHLTTRGFTSWCHQPARNHILSHWSLSKSTSTSQHNGRSPRPGFLEALFVRRPPRRREGRETWTAA